MTRRPLIRREGRDGVACLTLDRPAAYDALSLDLIWDLLTEGADMQTTPDLRVVIRAGAGCGSGAGQDVKEMRARSGVRARGAARAAPSITCGRRASCWVGCASLLQRPCNEEVSMAAAVLARVRYKLAEHELEIEVRRHSSISRWIDRPA